MATFPISNAPDYISYNEWRSAINRQGQLARNSRFAVRIFPMNPTISSASAMLRDLVFLAEATELPARGLVHASFRHYGPEYHLPVQSQYVDLNVQFLCRTESLERQFFDDWMDVINPPSTFDFAYKDSYKAKIEIFQFADYATDNDSDIPAVKYAWELQDAWPTLVNAQPVNWADGEFMRLTVTFSYTYWTRKNTPKPKAHPIIMGQNIVSEGGKTISKPLMNNKPSKDL